MNLVSIDLLKFTEEELIILNQKIVNRIKHIRQLNNLETLAQFKVGDIVSFTPSGKRKLIGRLIRLNTMTSTVLTQDNTQWTIPIQSMNKVKNPEKFIFAEKFLQNLK